MTEVKTARPKLSVRTGASRKLLERKALEKGQDAHDGGPVLEDSFPVADRSDSEGALVPVPAAADQSALLATAPEEADSAAVNQCSAIAPLLPDGTQEPASASSEAITLAPAPLQPSQAAWSPEDESLFQTLFARRKAAGHKRSREAGDQRLCVGMITPNPKTVVAVIAALVMERGGILTRDQLVAAMASAKFPHPKAQPKDPIWCRGYVAGALRNGFLALATEAARAEAA